jgi:ferredoxin-NADP reductase
MITKDLKIPAILQIKQDLAEGLAIFRFGLPRDFHFSAGQHATLWLTHKGSVTSRPYSIASSPNSKRFLELYINRVDRGELTPSLWDADVIRSLQEQDPETQVAISSPQGMMVLNPEERRDLLLIASGTGLAPFMSMIRKLNEDWILAGRHSRPRSILLIHGVSHSKQLGYRDELDGMAREYWASPGGGRALVYLPTVSRPHLDPDWKGLTGRAESLLDFSSAATGDASDSHRAQVKQLLRAILRPETIAVYACGHAGTVDGVEKFLLPMGFQPDSDIKREKYNRR